MDLTRYTLSICNINIWSSYAIVMVRMTKDKEKKDRFRRMVCDLDQVKETLKELKAENDELMRKLWKLHSENLELNEYKKMLE